MRVFARLIKHALDVPIECPQHTDARMHQEVAAFGGADQAGHRGLPFLEVLLGLRQFHDVGGGILKRDELPTARQRYRIVKRSFPTERPS
jgi:hypothetical protein